VTILYSSSCDETIPFSDSCAQLNLSTGVAQSYTVPGENNKKYSALFAFDDNANIFICLNNTAVAPGAGLKTETKRLEFRPIKRYVKGGDVLSILAPTSDEYVGISLRAIPN